MSLAQRARGFLQGRCQTGHSGIPLLPPQAHQAFWMRLWGGVFSASTPKWPDCPSFVPCPLPCQSDEPYCAPSSGWGPQALPALRTLARVCRMALELTLPPGPGLPSGGTWRGCTGPPSLPSLPSLEGTP